jgi:hypothetical protein
VKCHDKRLSDFEKKRCSGFVRDSRLRYNGSQLYLYVRSAGSDLGAAFMLQVEIGQIARSGKADLLAMQKTCTRARSRDKPMCQRVVAELVAAITSRVIWTVRMPWTSSSTLPPDRGTCLWVSQHDVCW